MTRTRQLTPAETQLYFGLYLALAWVFVVWTGTAASASVVFTGGVRHETPKEPPLTPPTQPANTLEPVKPGSPSNRQVSDAAADLCGVDRNFAWSLALRESSGRHLDNQGRVLRSKSGALGLFQVKPGTARDMGLDAQILFENALAGTCYYRAMLDRFGDPHRALVAYHRGPYGGTAQVSRDYADDIMEGSAQ